MVWDVYRVPFDATASDWTRFQTVLFANAATRLALFDDEQVGMGLRVVMDSAVSDIPFAALDPSVPLDEGMRMMKSMPGLWRDGFGPRLAGIHSTIGSSIGGRLRSACYMWFDVWPTFYRARDVLEWRDATWYVLAELLRMPWREVQVSALHGIGHNGRYLDRARVVDEALDAFVVKLETADEELRLYAEAARRGRVQ